MEIEQKESEINKKITENSLKANNYARNGNREQAIKYRDKTISLYELKEEKYSLKKSEKRLLKLLKFLARNTNSRLLKKKLQRKITKR